MKIKSIKAFAITLIIGIVSGVVGLATFGFIAKKYGSDCIP